MAKWCVGTLKIRGKKDNVANFMLNNFKIVEEDFSSKNYFEKHDLDKTIHIKDTIYIDGLDAQLKNGQLIDFWFYNSQEDIKVLHLEVEFRYDIVADDLLKLAKKYNLDFKIYAFECGFEFNRDVEIVNNQIIKDEKIKFNDYEWECICPTLGG